VLRRQPQPRDRHGDGGASGDSHVELKDDLFVGGDRAFAAGTSAHFENTGARGHTVTIHKVGEPSTSLRHDEALSVGEATQYTFTDAGTYHVWCKYHGTMTSGMAIVVTVS
jgi:plastocyanin